MLRISRIWLGLAAAVIVSLALVGCSSSGSSGKSVELKAGTIVIDVRTPAEYAAGHLEGAINMDVQDTGFTTQIAALDPKGSYVVYCRSGVRAANAQSLMKSRGFTDVVNAGGIDAASKATGLKIVQ